VLYQLTKHLLETKWRDAGEEPKHFLFPQLKAITRRWLEEHLVCEGGTYPALLLRQELKEIACNRITAAIVSRHEGERPIKAVLDAYNPVGSSAHVKFTTSKPRYATAADRCHVNYAVCDSDWEAEFCRVVERHPRVLAYVKNQGLGFEVPYRWGSLVRRYWPDFLVRVDDGQPGGLNLVVEIKGFRGEDAKEKRSTMDTYWVPGVNHLGQFGRWGFLELTEVFRMESDFEARVEAEVTRAIDAKVGVP
jgi:type III restriction enzyme